MPFWMLYLLSDCISWLLYYVIPYRKKVIQSNLTNSFPDKSTKEINELTRKFYKHFADLVVESFKLFSISKEEISKRFVLRNPEVLDQFYDNGKSVIMVGGHYNNWEVLASGIDFQMRHQGVGIYAKLENPFFNKAIKESRSKFGLNMITTKEVIPFFASEWDKPQAVIFGADQSPTYNKSVHWMRFLNQDTAVATGVERFARKFDMPVIYGSIIKVKRGFYACELKLLFENPNDAPPESISQSFTHYLEGFINEQPEYWLWTHKRWKRKLEEHEQVK